MAAGAGVNWLIAKYLATAAVVVLVSEVTKRSGRLGGLAAALPLVTVLALIWMHIEKQPLEKIADFSRYTFWYVVPTLPMFLILPRLLARVGFWPALAVGVMITLICVAGFAAIVRRFGIDLL
jgi:F0F1-type ATP synthase assembly protein I